MKQLFSSSDILYFKTADDRKMFIEQLQLLVVNHIDSKMHETFTKTPVHLQSMMLPPVDLHISKTTIPHVLIDSGTDLEKFLEENKTRILGLNFGI